jgi:nucleoside triphosphate pyrophosphatase
VISSTRPLLLGSASPRRRDILGSLRLPFVVLAADIVEDVLEGEEPLGYLERIASAKLDAIWARLERGDTAAAAAGGAVQPGPLAPGAVLVADTTVVIDGSIVGKPADVAEAVATLSRLVGREHEVYTRYVIGRAERGAGAVLRARTVRTLVRLRAATPPEIEAYARTGEGLDKAGAYAAQGIGSFLVEGVTGSYSNVVGLPACEVVRDLSELGLIGVFPALARPEL